MAKNVISAEEKKMLNRCYARHLGIFMSVCNIYMMGRSFANAMIPALRYYYPNQEDFSEQLLRHNELFNTHACVEGLIAGLAVSMEKQKAETGKVDGDMITSIKTALMGPLAGIGDSFFFNCMRVIVAGIALTFCADGNILGPIIFIVGYGVPQLILKYFLFMGGFSSGTTIIDYAFEKGIIPLITKAASILGMTMAGAMLSTNVNINIALAPMINGASVSIQGVFDAVLPGILSLALWFVCFRAFKKGNSPTKVVLTVLAACILLAAVGVF